MRRTHVTTEPSVLSEKRSAGNKYLIFRVDQVSYGISILKVKEIIGRQTITQIPETRDYIKGIINLRGKVIPVYDLRARMHKPERSPAESTIIVVEKMSEDNLVLAGLLVDAVSIVSHINKEDIEHLDLPMEHQHSHYVVGIAKEENHETILLDVEKMLSDEDPEALIDASSVDYL